MTEITLYNTRTRTKERFVPIDPANVRMYVCGPTVYDRAHIGNARPVVVFDTLFRLLRHVYGADHVTYVRNVTDVDDKINARAAESGRAIGEITAETARWFEEDMTALGALRPTHEPRATAYIAEMIAMIAALIARGHAYEAEGHVLFAVASYPDYGKFAHRSLDEMQAGARVEVAPYKRDPMDFVLWKPSDAATPGWDSPWGRGRPGWHIECSAMSEALLGTSFDIHGGGIDLMFPHHENEIAQSLCAHPGSTFATVWMHNGFLNVEGEKMSKSLGNFFTVRDLLDKGIPGEVIRFVLLSTHYRQPMDWTESKAIEALNTLTDWRDYTDEAEAGVIDPEFLTYIASDLNTGGAIERLHALRSQKNFADLKASANLVGLLDTSLSGWVAQYRLNNRVSELLEKLWSIRAEAVSMKDFSKIDPINDKIKNFGVKLRYSKDGADIASINGLSLFGFFSQLTDEQRRSILGDAVSKRSGGEQSIQYRALAHAYAIHAIATALSPEE